MSDIQTQFSGLVFPVVPKYLYHGTSWHHYLQIVGVNNHKGKGLQPHDGLIHLTSDFNEARRHALKKESLPGFRHPYSMVIVVNVEKAGQNYVFFEPGEGVNDWVCHFPLHTRCFEPPATIVAMPCDKSFLDEDFLKKVLS